VHAQPSCGFSIALQGLGVGQWVSGEVVRRAGSEQFGFGGEMAIHGVAFHARRSATALMVVRAGPTVPCRWTAASVIRRRVSAISPRAC